MKLIFAAAAIAAFATATQVQATTYDLGTLSSGVTSTSNTLVYDNTTGSDQSYSDTFDFVLPTTASEFNTGAFTISKPSGYSIVDADLTLYDSSNTLIGSTGPFDPETGPTPTLTALDLAPGAYHVVSSITVPGGDFGSYTVSATALFSAAPEPATWSLMLMGVGGLGMMLRRRKSAGPSLAGAVAG